MLLEGTPKVHLIQTEGQWFVWLSMPLTMLERQLHGLEPLPLTTAVRDEDDPSKMVAREFKIFAESSVVVYSDQTTAEAFANSLASHLEVDIDYDPNVLIPEHEIFEP